MKRFAAIFLPLVSAALLALPAVPAAADVNDFTVTDFTADYYLSKNDPQGALHIIENISVDFTDNNHGITRAIPESYQGQSLHVHVNSVSSTSGAPAEYTTSRTNGNEVLRIGDPNRTVTGHQEYTIDYTVQNVVTFYKDHDELYWDVNGGQWDQPFTAVQATLHVPAGARLWARQPVCYTGAYGATAHDCLIDTSPAGIMAAATDLAPGQTLTFVAGFDKGYFRPATWRDRLRDYAVPALQFVVPLAVIGGAGFIWWWKRGRDARGRGTLIPQYDAPDQLKPIEAGAVVDFRVDDRDLTATIIDLAIRNYLKIIESSGKKLFGKQKRYTLQLTNKDWSGLNSWEQELLGGFFGFDGNTGSVDLSAMKSKLQTHARNIKKSVEASLVDRAYFVSKPSKYLTISIPTIIFAVAAFGFTSPAALQGGWLLWGVVVGVAVFGVFYHFLPARTAKGTAAREHILGLKLYLQVAEKDRIKMLQSPDSPYAAKTAEPARTVELFERLLPYAIVLKVEEQWAGKFADVYKTQPDWYVGNYSAFTTGYLVGALGNGLNGAMASSFASPRSSSSSGFGGGGFAGGGGGGGGGGGW